MCKSYHLVWACFCWRIFSYDGCHFDGNTSHLSCTWFAAMFAVYTQHTVHVIHIVLLIRIEYRAWISVSTAVQQYASQSSSMLFCLFSVPFPLFCCCALCVIFIFYSSSLEACLFISYWACQVLFFASNSNTIYQHYGKKRRLIWHTDRQIYISIIIVACSLFFVRQLHDFLCLCSFSSLLLFIAFVHFLLKIKKNIRE